MGDDFFYTKFNPYISVMTNAEILCQFRGCGRLKNFTASLLVHQDREFSRGKEGGEQGVSRVVAKDPCPLLAR